MSFPDVRDASPSTPPSASKRRRLRAAATRKRIWQKSRWTFLAIDDEDAEEETPKKVSRVRNEEEEMVPISRMQALADKVAEKTAQKFEVMLEGVVLERERLRQKLQDMEQAQTALADLVAEKTAQKFEEMLKDVTHERDHWRSRASHAAELQIRVLELEAEHLRREFMEGSGAGVRTAVRMSRPVAAEFGFLPDRPLAGDPTSV